MVRNFGLRVTSGDEWTQNDNLKLFPSTFDARKDMYTWTLEPKSEEGGGVIVNKLAVRLDLEGRWDGEGVGGWRSNVVFLILMWYI